MRRVPGTTIGRRDFLLGALAAAMPVSRLRAESQYVVGYWGAWFAAGRPDPKSPPRVAWLEAELAGHGFEVRRNLRIEYAFTGWDTRHEIGAEAQRLIDARPNVVWPRLDLSYQKRVALRALSPTLPLVVDYWDDTMASKEVGDLRRPAGNVTGVATNYGLLSHKRLQLVREILPRAKRVAVVSDFASYDPAYYAALDSAASGLGLELLRIDVPCASAPDTLRGAEVLEAALASMRVARPDAYMSFGSYACAPLRDQQLEAFELEHRIPYIHDAGSTGSAVGLGWDYADHRKRAVLVIAKLLRGARPAEIPIEVTSRVLFTVNPARAKAIGLHIPPAVLLRADRVIGGAG